MVHSSLMARPTIEKDVDKDRSRLDEALEHVLGVIRTELPKTGDADSDAVNEVAMSRVKLEACKALVPLLERRSKLLGLDAPEQKAGSSDATDTIAAVTRRLEAVK